MYPEVATVIFCIKKNEEEDIQVENCFSSNTI